MWFLSKFVEQKNKAAWKAQAAINVNILSAIDTCTKYVDEKSDLYFDELKQLSCKIREIELKLEKKGKK